MNELICDVCGSSIPASSKFCSDCGDPVTAADLPADQFSEAETVKLVCPKCDKQNLYQVSVDGSAQLSCTDCTDQFDVRVMEIRSKRSRGSKKDGNRSYTVRAKTLTGREELIEFSDGSFSDFEMKSKDLVAFISRRGELAIVQNLTLRNYMTISRGCFLATAVYGPTANETTILRKWRDEFLRRSTPGIFFIRVYYALSPRLVKRVHLFPFGPSLARCALSPIICYLKARTRRSEMSESNSESGPAE